jgi:hypothetical protein
MHARQAWLGLLLGLVGCHTIDGPASIELASGDYDRAFDACILEGRALEMPPAVADRGNGVIETEPRTMGSLVEPWRLDHSGPSQVLESTVQFQRRRVRFLFAPTGFEPNPIDGQAEFAGGAEPGSPEDVSRFDLERYQGTIELRAHVFIERGFVPNIRKSTWSNGLSSIARDAMPRAADDGSDRMPTLWTPVGRDEEAERTLLARIQARLQEQAPADNATSGPPAGEPSS